MKTRSLSALFLPMVAAAVYLFLYVPIILLILFSCNNDQFAHTWVGFTTRWYHALFGMSEVWDALKNSLIVACASVVCSLTMGSLLVFFGRKKYLRRIMGMFYASLALPEIVLAVGLLSFFYFFSVRLGFTSLIASHTIIGLGYVVPIIYERYMQLDKAIIEASYDLGATPHQSFITVVLPMLSPALVSSALLVFIVSFDDFFLSFFCSGAATQTLPIYIFSLIRTGSSPVVNALSTLLLATSSGLMLLFFSLQNKKTDLLR